MTNVLSRIEQNGIKINLDTLAAIRQEYETELSELDIKLTKMAQDAMGDTPINLASPDDRSILLYSRKVKDKSIWSIVFNLGHEIRGATSRPKFKTRMKHDEFKRNIRSMTDVVYKTVGSHCESCNGQGRNSFILKSGKKSKAMRVCKSCKGNGIIYTKTTEVAGFKLVPRSPVDIASAGFKTDKVTLSNRLDALEGDAHEFIKAYTRYNALKTYINTFV